MTIQVRRSGAYANAPVKVRRSGSWVSPSGVFVRRSGSWVRADPFPFSVTMVWTGSIPLHVIGASGSTSGSNRFVHTENDGVTPYSNETVTITSNPTGKLSLTTVGTGLGLAWSGLAVGESASITVKFSAKDASGTTKTASDTTIIVRDS